MRLPSIYVLVFRDYPMFRDETGLQCLRAPKNGTAIRWYNVALFCRKKQKHLSHHNSKLFSLQNKNAGAVPNKSKDAQYLS